MAKTDFKSVDQYIASQPEAVLMSLIMRITKFRAKEVAEQKKTKAPTRSKRRAGAVA